MRNDKRYVASQKSSDTLRIYYSGYRDVNKKVMAQNYFFLPGNEAEAQRHEGHLQLNTWSHSKFVYPQVIPLGVPSARQNEWFCQILAACSGCAHMRT